MARPKKSAEITDGMVRVRLLGDCIFGRCNDVVEIAVEQLSQAVETGVADPDPAAVAYAESLKG